MSCWLGIRALKTLYLYFCKVIKLYIKEWIERIFAKNFVRNYEKNDTWIIRGLVDKTVIPATQCIILKIVGANCPNVYTVYKFDKGFLIGA